MNQLTLQVTGTKPFSEGKFLNFTANTPTGPIEGISWEQGDHHFFQPGNSLVIGVGTDKKDGACWQEYRGKTRLEVSKGAQIGFAASGAPAQPQAYQPPAQAAPQASYAPPAGNLSSGTKTGEEIVARAAQLARRYADELQRNGFSQAVAEQAAASTAGTIVSQWWFGDGKWA